MKASTHDALTFLVCDLICGLLARASDQWSSAQQRCPWSLSVSPRAEQQAAEGLVLLLSSACLQRTFPALCPLCMFYSHESCWPHFLQSKETGSEKLRTCSRHTSWASASTPHSECALPTPTHCPWKTPPPRRPLPGARAPLPTTPGRTSLSAASRGLWAVSTSR